MNNKYKIYKGLHIGCYDCVLSGWYNTDVTPHIIISRLPGIPFLLSKIGMLSKPQYEKYTKKIFSNIHWLNVARRFPIPDSSFKFSFSSHVLEHLYVEQAIYCLKEVNRILMPGGIIRVSVPDLDLAVKTYDYMKPDSFCKTVFESGSLRDKNRHHWMYNEISLKKVLSLAGFTDISRKSFRVGNCCDVESIDNRPESLFMEGTKQ